MKQRSFFRTFFYMILSLITGYCALMLYFIDIPQINTNVLSLLFTVSFVGHMISFLKELK